MKMTGRRQAAAVLFPMIKPLYQKIGCWGNRKSSLESWKGRRIEPWFLAFQPVALAIAVGYFKDENNQDWGNKFHSMTQKGNCEWTFKNTQLETAQIFHATLRGGSITHVGKKLR
jgi:hypothetical protein